MARLQSSSPWMHAAWNAGLPTQAPSSTSVVLKQDVQASVSGPAPPQNALVSQTPAQGAPGPQAQASKAGATAALAKRREQHSVHSAVGFDGQGSPVQSAHGVRSMQPPATPA